MTRRKTTETVSNMNQTQQWLFERDMDSLALNVGELHDGHGRSERTSQKQLLKSSPRSKCRMQQIREKRRNSGYPTSSHHSVTSSVGQDPREVLCRLGDRRKGMAKIKRKNLETICFGWNRFGHWSGDPMCTARDRRKVDGQENITVKLSREPFLSSPSVVEEELTG